MLILRSHYNEPPDLQGDLIFKNSQRFEVNFHSTPFFGQEICSPLIGTIFKSHFQPASYPSRASLNSFCPFCLHHVSPTSPFMVSTQPIFQKTYIAHTKCLQLQKNNCLNTIVDDINHARVVFASDTSQIKQISVGQKEYYIEMQCAHSLTSRTYFTLKSKVNTHNVTNLIWNFTNSHETNSYFPNIIAFPFPDIDLSISLSKMSQMQSQTTFKAYVNLQKIKCQSDRLIRISTEQFDLVAKVIYQKQAKRQIIDQMNYKYRYPIDIDYPIIQLIQLQIKMLTLDEDQSCALSQENSSITELLNQSSSYQSSLRSVSQAKKESKSTYLSDSNESHDRQKVNLSWLISSKKLGEYVRNSTQSRNFQSFLQQASEDELNQILEALSFEIAELTIHQYANYMIQKLFAKCTQKQRLIMLHILLPDLSSISMSMQGTHTLQSFMPFLSQHQEQTIIVQHLNQQMVSLASHSNATHLLQKIIQVFPLVASMPFFVTATQHFVELCLNKNAICVLKQMMKKIKQTEDVQNQSLMELKKQLIRPLLMNLNKIIQDSYGNYVVQFFYDYFGQKACFKITEIILKRFHEYSIHKFSGSVVYKCLQTYWTNIDMISQIQVSLSSTVILDLYRNKEGNKILLALMQKYEGSMIREKLYCQLMMAEPTKFNQDQWRLVLGSRSGTVGTQYNNFTEAMKSRAIKKKKYYDIIQ